ncbi:hypothetical protein COO60DRAFT_1627023 [Scenedesmus sp. NREL 46B-D3]|nr:hypothetical protein COO60DRAFT_1627023 [Scenedesmus sp. NREL 46B-D3]
MMERGLASQIDDLLDLRRNQSYQRDSLNVHFASVIHHIPNSLRRPGGPVTQQSIAPPLRLPVKKSADAQFARCEQSQLVPAGRCFVECHEPLRNHSWCIGRLEVIRHIAPSCCTATTSTMPPGISPRCSMGLCPLLFLLLLGGSRRLLTTGFLVTGVLKYGGAPINSFDPLFGYVPDLCSNSSPCGNTDNGPLVVQVDNDIEFGFTRPIGGTNSVVDEVDITASGVITVTRTLRQQGLLNLAQFILSSQMFCDYKEFSQNFSTSAVASFAAADGSSPGTITITVPSSVNAGTCTATLSAVLCVVDCTREPGATNLPDYAAWSCSSSTSGSTCEAQCDAGYTPQAGTSWQATCSAGSWGTPAAQDGQNALTCTPDAALAAHPAARAGLSAMLATRPQAGTSWQATCSAASWGTPAAQDGQNALTCTPDDCTGEPEATDLPDHAAWSCSGSTSGSTCKAQCDAGYTPQAGTSWHATCSAGSWGTPAAQDGQNALTCTPDDCTGEPEAANFPDHAAWSCSSSTSGSTCKAQCDAGYTPQAGTSWQATCSAASWGTPAAQDGQNALTCTPDAAQEGQSKLDCQPSRDSCSTACDPRHVLASGSLTVTCSLGVWSTPSGVCAVLPTQPGCGKTCLCPGKNACLSGAAKARSANCCVCAAGPRQRAYGANGDHTAYALRSVAGAVHWFYKGVRGACTAASQGAASKNCAEVVAPLMLALAMRTCAYRGPLLLFTFDGDPSVLYLDSRVQPGATCYLEHETMSVNVSWLLACSAGPCWSADAPATACAGCARLLLLAASRVSTSACKLPYASNHTCQHTRLRTHTRKHTHTRTQPNQGNLEGPSLMAQKPCRTAVIFAMQPGVPLDPSDLQVKYGLPKPDGAAAAGR